MKNIGILLTSEDKQEIRQSVKEIVIKQIENDFENYGNYLFDPEEIECMVRDAMEEVKDEIKPIIKEKLMEEAKERLGWTI